MRSEDCTESEGTVTTAGCDAWREIVAIKLSRCRQNGLMRNMTESADWLTESSIVGRRMSSSNVCDSGSDDRYKSKLVEHCLWVVRIRCSSI